MRLLGRVVYRAINAKKARLRYCERLAAERSEIPDFGDRPSLGNFKISTNAEKDAMVP